MFISCIVFLFLSRLGKDYGWEEEKLSEERQEKEN